MILHHIRNTMLNVGKKEGNTSTPTILRALFYRRGGGTSLLEHPEEKRVPVETEQHLIHLTQHTQTHTTNNTQLMHRTSITVSTE